jgi:hypothetical protein
MSSLRVTAGAWLNRPTQNAGQKARFEIALTLSRYLPRAAPF